MRAGRHPETARNCSSRMAASARPTGTEAEGTPAASGSMPPDRFPAYTLLEHSFHRPHETQGKDLQPRYRSRLRRFLTDRQELRQAKLHTAHRAPFVGQDKV